MKYKSVAHWQDIEAQNGLVFFSQILDEALFDYSLGSYKPLALNSRLLCIEALGTLSQIKSGLIKKPNLKSILDELEFRLNSDVAAKTILGNQFPRFQEKIKSNPNDKELVTTIQLLYHNLDDKKYLQTIQELLINKVPAAREKESIYKLSRDFLTELINYGYSPGYIFLKANQYFFDRRNRVTTDNPESFFQLFDFKKQKYKVVFKVSKVFKEFESFANGLKITISDTHESFPTAEERHFIESKTNDEVFIVCNDVEALDDISARIRSEMPLISISNLFSFYHHKERPQISESAIVIKESDNSYVMLEKPLKAIIKKGDIKPKIAAGKVKTLYESLNLPNDTIYRIARGIDLHSIALETNEIENKLLSLWTATETLIPKVMDSDQDRIIQIINGLSPFQSYKYFEEIFQQIKSDIHYYNQRLSRDIFRQIILPQRDNLFNTIAAFIVTSENDTARKSAYGHETMKQFPLLKWRIFHLSKTFENGAAALSHLNSHKQRVEWQIRRIYRVRNLIVHSGKKPSYTNILVENFHNYFDNFMNIIIDTAIEEKKIKTINQGIMDIEFKVKNHIETLEKHKSSPTTLANYKEILRG